ncbi:hypothetical protein OUZ56_022206 [Daphnia magna]|uniref:Uncharacterized protein n=1 Tax=Daphnia magna TaxID=35525 RepID=A0ABR0AVQ1_9CRUS|nr:hypothetical protein OUZ56_022206 [Daphnia magna]
MEHWTISLIMVYTLATFATTSGVYSQQSMLMEVDNAGHHHFDIEPSTDGTHLRNQYTNIHLLVAEIRHSKKESKRCDVTRMWNIAHDFEMDIRDKNVYA